MDIEKAVRSLATPLPEDIMKRKWAGDFAGASAAITRQLQEELPEMLRYRLLVEQSAPDAHAVSMEPRRGFRKASGACAGHHRGGI